MGLIIAKFRRKKSNTDILENLDKQIRDIEDYRRNTEQQQKRIIGQFLVFSIGVYLSTAFLFYFYFYPTNIKDRLLYSIPLILAPAIIFCLKRLLTWHYSRKIRKNQDKLVQLKNEKKKILEMIMETETYKVARGILEKYAPEQVRKVGIPVATSELTPVKQQITPTASSDVRNRFPPAKPTRTTSASTFQTPSRPALPLIRAPQASGTLTAVGVPTPYISKNQIVPSGSLVTGGTPLPRAILPRDRSVLDKMVEYLVGDGPSNRFALICKQCASHNGMALQEEFEYLSYRCCYCYTFNPARKKRPAAPRLELQDSLLSSPILVESSDTDKNSGSDTDQETQTPHESKKSLATATTESLYDTELKEQAKTSDNEPVSDFDKLSDIELNTEIGDDKEVKVSEGHSERAIIESTSSDNVL